MKYIFKSFFIILLFSFVSQLHAARLKPNVLVQNKAKKELGRYVTSDSKYSVRVNSDYSLDVCDEQRALIYKSLKNVIYCHLFSSSLEKGANYLLYKDKHMPIYVLWQFPYKNQNFASNFPRGLKYSSCGKYIVFSFNSEMKIFDLDQKSEIARVPFDKDVTFLNFDFAKNEPRKKSRYIFSKDPKSCALYDIERKAIYLLSTFCIKNKNSTLYWLKNKDQTKLENRFLIYGPNKDLKEIELGNFSKKVSIIKVVSEPNFAIILFISKQNFFVEYNLQTKSTVPAFESKITLDQQSGVYIIERPTNNKKNTEVFICKNKLLYATKNYGSISDFNIVKLLGKNKIAVFIEFENGKKHIYTLLDEKLYEISHSKWSLCRKYVALIMEEKLYLFDMEKKRPITLIQGIPVDNDQFDFFSFGTNCCYLKYKSKKDGNIKYFDVYKRKYEKLIISSKHVLKFLWENKSLSIFDLTTKDKLFTFTNVNSYGCNKTKRYLIINRSENKEHKIEIYDLERERIGYEFLWSKKTKYGEKIIDIKSDKKLKFKFFNFNDSKSINIFNDKGALKNIEICKNAVPSFLNEMSHESNEIQKENKKNIEINKSNPIAFFLSTFAVLRQSVNTLKNCLVIDYLNKEDLLFKCQVDSQSGNLLIIFGQKEKLKKPKRKIRRYKKRVKRLYEKENKSSTIIDQKNIVDSNLIQKNLKKRKKKTQDHLRREENSRPFKKRKKT